VDPERIPVCICVCVCEREREREGDALENDKIGMMCVCVCVCVHSYPVRVTRLRTTRSASMLSAKPVATSWLRLVQY
jgi:hypothetical protein